MKALTTWQSSSRIYCSPNRRGHRHHFCFVGGSPTLPVYAGQIHAGLVWRLSSGGCESFVSVVRGSWFASNPSRACPSVFGMMKTVLVITADRFANVWCHGDYGELTAQGGVIIHGRSDAVLNPGGVRIGTAEIYRQVEKLEVVQESLVIGQDWKDDVRVVLFVVLKDPLTLDQALQDLIRQTIRSNTTPRHVPAKIIQVPEIPRTLSGKIVELAVRNIVHGRAVTMRCTGKPQSLEYFSNLPDLQA